MIQLKANYRGNEDVVVCVYDDEAGNRTYRLARGPNDGRVANLYAQLQLNASNIEVVSSFEGINASGIRAIQSVFGEALMNGKTNITPSDIESEICEPNSQSSSK